MGRGEVGNLIYALAIFLCWCIFDEESVEWKHMLLLYFFGDIQLKISFCPTNVFHCIALFKRKMICSSLFFTELRFWMKEISKALFHGLNKVTVKKRKQTKMRTTYLIDICYVPCLWKNKKPRTSCCGHAITFILKIKNSLKLAALQPCFRFYWQGRYIPDMENLRNAYPKIAY